MTNLAVFDASLINTYVRSEEAFPVPFEGLWQACGYGKKSDAVKYMKSDFVEGLDFCGELRKSTGGRPSSDFFLTSDAAKVFAVRARTEKGVAIAKVFIRAFEELRQQLKSQPKDFYGMMHYALDQMQAIEVQQQEHERRLDGIDCEIDRIKNPDGYFYTVLGYSNLKGIKNLDRKTAAAIGRRVSRYSRENGLPINQVHDTRFGMVNTYHTDALEVAFEEFE